MQSFITSENKLAQESTHELKLKSRSILKDIENTNLNNQTPNTPKPIKYSYPKNGLYGLL